MVFSYVVEGDTVRDVCVQAEKHLETFADVRTAQYVFTHGSFEEEMAVRWYLAALKTELLLDSKLITVDENGEVGTHAQTHDRALLQVEQTIQSGRRNLSTVLDRLSKLQERGDPLPRVDIVDELESSLRLAIESRELFERLNTLVKVDVESSPHASPRGRDPMVLARQFGVVAYRPNRPP